MGRAGVGGRASRHLAAGCCGRGRVGSRRLGPRRVRGARLDGLGGGVRGGDGRVGRQLAAVPGVVGRRAHGVAGSPGCGVTRHASRHRGWGRAASGRGRVLRPLLAAAHWVRACGVGPWTRCLGRWAGHGRAHRQQDRGPRSRCRCWPSSRSSSRGPGHGVGRAPQPRVHLALFSGNGSCGSRTVPAGLGGLGLEQHGRCDGSLFVFVARL